MACQVKVVARSAAPTGEIITTVECRYWRAIHAELMTHRVFSRNASSSRAKPVSRVFKEVWSDPAGPIHWGVNQKGMQAKLELYGWRKITAGLLWRIAGKMMCVVAWLMMQIGLHKQVANRLLEPWQYIKVLITSTEWNNFYELRCHPDAQPEFQELAYKIRNEIAATKPRHLKYGEWHLPYVTDEERATLPTPELIRVSVARCARTSYDNHDGSATVVTKDVKLHNDLVVARPIHASPAEHQAVPMDPNSRDLEKLRGNFNVFAQYRKFVEFGATAEYAYNFTKLG